MTERTENMVYELVAKAHGRFLEVPSMESLGLDTENKSDRLTASVITLAVMAGNAMAEDGFRNFYTGQLVAMIEYGIIDMDRINSAIFKFRN